ncbi:hypothetical protein OPV22_011925 [Ensete ventricosum]|uniref:Uncharacterized protein n=1 Tax=Ensete ventricosum TaxID=4639 RepID=A0AAV8RPJ7_ENSVE|nr:hypothetical protein OPV22_011925 [Ensete ventricosum]
MVGLGVVKDVIACGCGVRDTRVHRRELEGGGRTGCGCGDVVVGCGGGVQGGGPLIPWPPFLASRAPIDVNNPNPRRLRDLGGRIDAAGERRLPRPPLTRAVHQQDVRDGRPSRRLTPPVSWGPANNGDDATSSAYCSEKALKCFDNRALEDGPGEVI